MFCTGAYDEKEKQISRKLRLLAVIATDCGGLPEQIIHGKPGLLVPPQHSSAMADALRQLILNLEQTAAMGRTGELRVRSIADLRHQSSHLERLLKWSVL